MRRWHGAVAVLAGAILAGCEEPPEVADVDEAPRPAAVPECDPDDGGIVLPEGFCALVVHEGVGRARHIAVTDGGDLYVRLRNTDPGGGIAAVRDETGDGRADRVEYFDGTTGTGIAVRDGWLYFSSDTDVYRVRLPAGGEDGLVPADEPEMYAGGFPDQRGHAAKSFTFDPRGNLYVNVGSPTNSCQPVEADREPGVPGQDPCPEYDRHTGVFVFPPGDPGMTQTEDARNHATGIRNSVAIAWSEAADGLYVVQHGRDLLDRMSDAWTPEENAELPAEEFHRLEPGDTLAYPYCFYDPFQEAFVLAPEYGGEGQPHERCEATRPPLTSYPAHWAPNDLLFYGGDLFPARYRGGAFVAWHGSWNRAPLPQRGYKVTFQPMAGGEPAGDWVVFADGFRSEDEIYSPGDARHRPMGLAEGPDGSLYLVESNEGKIWRIVYTG